jgi:ABC-type cobalamin/Fe3+-siderophores transport system ATPase subunit
MAHLDENLRLEIWQELFSFQEKSQKSLVIATHHYQSTFAQSHEFLFLDHGQCFFKALLNKVEITLQVSGGDI